ncbi:MAG: hypothetical protein WED05_12490 [Candidatus Atabeyarchaeum deiterrae]
MSKGLNISLRELIYSRMAERDGCYLFLYSGLGEKLAFLNSFLKASRIEALSNRLLIDADAEQYVKLLSISSYTLLNGSHAPNMEESGRSLYLNTIQREVSKLEGDARLSMAAELTSVPFLKESATDEDALSFHKEIISLICSARNVTSVLMYNTDSLSESVMFKLLESHQFSPTSLRVLGSPSKLKDEYQNVAKDGKCSPAIKSLRDGIVFLDPPSDSVALLVPNSDVVKGVLPKDPLDLLQGDIAFINSYTAHDGSCPHSCPSAQSGCLLDPNVIHAIRHLGKPFVEGHRCSVAADYALFDTRAEKKRGRSLPLRRRHL